MKTSLKVFAIIAVIIGGLAVLSSLTGSVPDASASFIGGGFVLAYGWVTLSYLSKNK
jgi:hypothetical protein